MSAMKPQRGKTPAKKISGKKTNNSQTDPVEVYCRIRPLSDENMTKCVKVLSPSTVQLIPSENSHAVRYGGIIKETRHSFKYVFDENMSQKALFDHTAMPLVEDVLRGKNALLFAYGITSSGKTHTMTGVPHNQGVLPRCLDVLFNSIGELQAKKYVFKPDKMNGFDIQSEADAMMERQRRDIMPKLVQTPGTPRMKEDRFDANKTPRVRDTSKVPGVEEDNVYAIFVSYVEIYNNYVYDLVEELAYDPIMGNRPPQPKTLREDSNHNMYVSGVCEVEVKSTEEAYDVLFKGQKRRKVAHTSLNTESSRSHSVFNIRLVQAPLDPIGEEVLQDIEKICISQLSLVDLAGSERALRTGSQGDRLKEAGSINQCLMGLRSCIETLRENQTTHTTKLVPYRNSRLTHLFKNYFDGEGKVRMIICVNPSADEYDETIHVMKFAEMTQEVQIARPQLVRFDIGLTPGRRRLNQQYKDAIAKAKEDGADPMEIQLPEPMVYSMGPPFPSLVIRDCEDDTFLGLLVDFLKQREVRRSTLLADLSTKDEAFRNRLVEMEKENTSLRRRVADLESMVEVKDTEMNKMQKKVKSLEKAHSSLQRTATICEQEKRDLARELDDKDWKISQEKNEKNRLRIDYRAKQTLLEQNFQRQIDKTKKKVMDERQSEIRRNQHKLDLLRNIINQDPTSSDSSTGTTQSRHRAATVSARIYPAKSEPDLSSSSTDRITRTPFKPSIHTRAVTSAYSQPVTKGVPRTRRRSPPPTKPKPAYNPRYHRRSKSSDNIWLEHKPTGTVDTGTVMQPHLKKKRSVTNLREKDVQRDANKYILTHQELDSEGDFATKLVKGDIVPTSGGGAAVVFNDVEVIKQTSPGDRKRKSPPRKPEDYEGEWSDVETRCKIAIEGHGYSKRPKTSAV